MSIDAEGCNSLKLIYIWFVSDFYNRITKISYHFVASIEIGFSSFFSCCCLESSLLFRIVEIDVFSVSLLSMAIISAMFRRLPSRARYSVAIYLWCLLRNKFGSVAFLSAFSVETCTDNEWAIESNSLYSSISDVLVSIFLSLSLSFWRVFLLVVFLVEQIRIFLLFTFQCVCIFCLVAGSWKSPPSKCTHKKFTTSSSQRWNECTFMCVCVSVCAISSWV